MLLIPTGSCRNPSSRIPVIGSYRNSRSFRRFLAVGTDCRNPGKGKSSDCSGSYRICQDLIVGLLDLSTDWSFLDLKSAQFVGQKMTSLTTHWQIKSQIDWRLPHYSVEWWKPGLDSVWHSRVIQEIVVGSFLKSDSTIHDSLMKLTQGRKTFQLSYEIVVWNLLFSYSGDGLRVERQINRKFAW